MKNRLIQYGALFGLFGLLAGCGGGKSTPTPENLIIATTMMVADLIKAVGQEDITVHTLMGPSIDPHLYKATPQDVSLINKAKAVFYSGLLLEGRMTDLFTKMTDQGKYAFAVTDAISADKQIAPEHAEGHPDPHIWGDALLWSTTLDTVVAGLGAVYPDKHAVFVERAKAYQEELVKLHQWSKDQVAQIPEEKRKLVTSHDAFAYFGRAYGLEVIGVQGISTSSDVSVADRTRMVDYLKQNQIPAIFVESSVSPVLIEQIGKDANVRVGGELFSDAMGEPGEMHTVDGDTYDVGTYPGMLKHNVYTVVKALK